MNPVREIIRQLREDAALCENMRGVYPGDPDGSMGVHAALLVMAADNLNMVNWELAEKNLYINRPQVTITVTRD